MCESIVRSSVRLLIYRRSERKRAAQAAAAASTPDLEGVSSLPRTASAQSNASSKASSISNGH